MDFAISEEERLVQLTVRRFAQQELLPLERAFLMVNQIPDDVEQELAKKARRLGLWALSYLPKPAAGLARPPYGHDPYRHL